MDIHQALNWQAIWPVLRELPADVPLSVLDAGCGDGAWCRRVAALRPRWHVTGIDRDVKRIQEGIRKAKADPSGSVCYIHGDFIDGVAGRYDVIFSIASIHYAATSGSGVAVLRNLRSALTPGGQLILLVPRRDGEQPVWSALPRPQAWPVFAAEEIRAMMTEAGLFVRQMHGLYGGWCVLGKQIALWGAASPVRRLASAPLQVMVRISPFGLLQDARKPSYALRVVAGCR